MAIPDYVKTNFETLTAAFHNEDVAVMECADAESGEPVYVVCAVTLSGAQYTLVPLAKMITGDPFEEILPPTDVKTVDFAAREGDEDPTEPA